MSAITEYLDDIERLLDNIPFKLSTKIHVENRGDIALYIRGEVEFVRGAEYFNKVDKKVSVSFLHSWNVPSPFLVRKVLVLYGCIRKTVDGLL